MDFSLNHKCQLTFHPFKPSNCSEALKYIIYVTVSTVLWVFFFCFYLFSQFLTFLGQMLTHSHHVLMAHFSAGDAALQTVSLVLSVVLYHILSVYVIKRGGLFQFQLKLQKRCVYSVYAQFCSSLSRDLQAVKLYNDFFLETSL